MQRKKKMEVLAPAGNYETMKAVIEAGADAVYLGGPAFGARAYAGNFTKEELLEAIDYAHLRGRRVYLTVNTLLKNQEISQIPDYLRPYYEQGLDAVLVQDFGALQVIHEAFPELEIHTSTQMTVTGVDGVRFLQNYHVTRVVMAREVSLAEMKRIHDETGIELEAFVHGAICYCYSGQCLFSSMLGGRSGNRGRCAQPCRLPYSLGKNQVYCLSLKDMCGIEDIQALYEAGVYSLKIEGRMKSSDYAAGVTAIYRKYTDRIEQQQSVKVSDQDKKHLADLGSRCGFTDDYYYRQNGKNMLTIQKPNFEYKDPEYHERVLDRYVKNPSKVPVNGSVTLRKGEPAGMELWTPDIKVRAAGMEAAPAQKKPLESTDVKKRMTKTGDTEFVIEDLQVSMDDDVFMPNGALNQLRRDAFEELKTALLAGTRRGTKKADVPDEGMTVKREAGVLTNGTEKNGTGKKEMENTNQKRTVACLAETRDQLSVLLHWKMADILYADIHIYEDQPEMYRRDLAECRRQQKKFYLALPQILRTRGEKTLHSFLQRPDFEIPDGFLVRNYEELGMMKREYPEADLVTDHNLYTYNDIASEAFLKAGVQKVTMPLELNAGEIAARCNTDTEMIVYGYYPLMVSAQCIHGNMEGCDHRPGLLWIKDRYQARFPVKNYCKECYNVIYNSVPVWLVSYERKLQASGVNALRLQFTIETGEETAKILGLTEDLLRGKGRADREISAVTNGHYKRGVE